MVMPLIGAWFYFVLFSESPVAKAIYTGTKLFTLAWPLIVIKLIYGNPFPRVRWGDARHWRALPLGIVTGTAIVALMVGLLFTPLRGVVEQGSDSIRAKTQALGIMEHYWIFGFFLSVIHSLLEEYYWRWFVYGQLTRVVSGPLAHVLAGVAFAAHHVVIVGQFFGLMWGFFFGAFVGIGGIIWSLMLARQKTLFGIWISHMIVDFGCLSIGYWLITGA